MLSTVTKLRRYIITSQCSWTIINNKFKYSRQSSSLSSSIRGYTVQYSINTNINKIKSRYCHATIVQCSSKENSIKSIDKELSNVEYERIANDTLESLTEYFDGLIENADHLNDADVTYGDGVLTIKFGNKYGTYVINRQTPNKQIWLSSPSSGPKRYDFIDNTWIYKHDGNSLHQLLDSEISSIIKFTTSFDKCAYSRKIQ